MCKVQGGSGGRQTYTNLNGQPGNPCLYKSPFAYRRPSSVKAVRRVRASASFLPMIPSSAWWDSQALPRSSKFRVQKISSYLPILGKKGQACVEILYNLSQIHNKTP